MFSLSTSSDKIHGKSFIKGQAPGKLPSCEEDFAHLVKLDQQEESFVFIIKGKLRVIG